VSGVWTIIVAGGTGQRFGQPKQFALLGGRPVVEWSIQASRPWSDGLIVVLPAGSDDGYGADAVVVGGATRSESVRAGLAQVPADADVIVVHDAARPLAPAVLFRDVIAAVAEGGADGAIPGVEVRDTIKQVDGERHVVATFERAALVAVQTPQAFSAGVLRRAHAGGADATDDAALVEALGATVRVVPGDARNMKITTPDDLRAAQRVLDEGV
jgi:2-C-methyl-D-erythritol 4-phosphate cytidylyltransferase